MKKTKTPISSRLRKFFVNLLFEPKFGKHAGIIFLACLIGCYYFYPDSENSLGNSLIVSYTSILIVYWMMVLFMNIETSKKIWQGMKVILPLLVLFSGLTAVLLIMECFKVGEGNPPSIQVSSKIILVYILGFTISYALQDEDQWRFRRMEKWRTRRLI